MLGLAGPVRLAASHLLAEFGGQGAAATADPGSAGGSNFESLLVITRMGPPSKVAMDALMRPWQLRWRIPDRDLRRSKPTE